MNAKRLPAAEVEHLLEGYPAWYLGRDVATVGAIETSRPQLVPHEKNGFVRKKNIDVRRKHEPSTRAPDAHVLGDHLEQRQLVAVGKACMELARHGDNAYLARPGIRRPFQLFDQRPSVSRRVPLDQHELRAETMSPALRDEPIDEMLHAMR